MKKFIFLFALVLIGLQSQAQDPNVAITFANPQYIASNIYRFDIMVQATGATSTFQLRTFQAGIYVNPTWVNGGTLYMDNISSSMIAPGYNGAFQWNATDKLINCSVNTGVRTGLGCIATVVGTTPVKVATIQLSNSVNFLSCATPDLRFNYVQNANPLRLRTSVSWRAGAGCAVNYDMFYPNRTYGGQAFFNNELYASNDADGKSPVLMAANDPFCYNTLNLTAFIEGYYLGGGTMQSCLLNCAVPRASFNQADTITVELYLASNTASPVSKYQAVLGSDGVAQVAFPSSLLGQSCYIAVRHRNSIETWSASPITLTASSNYDFSSSSSQAFGDNQIEIEPGIFAMYSGDISSAVDGVGFQDGIVESQDYADMENANFVTAIGYVPEDITGDGVVESSDYAIMENNNYFTVFAMKP